MQQAVDYDQIILCMSGVFLFPSQRIIAKHMKRFSTSLDSANYFTKSVLGLRVEAFWFLREEMIINNVKLTCKNLSS